MLRHAGFVWAMFGSAVFVTSAIVSSYDVRDSVPVYIIGLLALLIGRTFLIEDAIRSKKD